MQFRKKRKGERERERKRKKVVKFKKCLIMCHLGSYLFTTNVQFNPGKQGQTNQLIGNFTKYIVYFCNVTDRKAVKIDPLI